MFGCWIPRSRDRMIVWSTKTRAGKDTQKYTLTYDAESGRLDQMGDFEDSDKVAMVVKSKEKRQQIRKKFAAGDETPMNAVPIQQVGAEPPVEVTMGAYEAMEDDVFFERDSFLGGGRLNDIRKSKPQVGFLMDVLKKDY